MAGISSLFGSAPRLHQTQTTMATSYSGSSSAPKPAAPPSSHSSSDETRAANTPTDSFLNGVSKPTASPAARHEDLDFFDKAGHQELARRLSRFSTRRSTHTQDPAAEEFDYKQHLTHLLRKEEKEGVLRRELGVSFENLKVTGDGSGLSIGPSMGELLTGVTRIGSAIKAMRHATRKNILVDFTGVVRPGEMLLVLGR